VLRGDPAEGVSAGWKVRWGGVFRPEPGRADEERRVFAIWRGNLPREILNIGQQGYAAAEALAYPEGLEIIDCGLGTNPLGAPECLRGAIVGSRLPDLDVYPDPDPEALREALASAHPAWGIGPERILVGGGSIGVLVTLVRLLLRPGSVMAGRASPPSSPIRSSRLSTMGPPMTRSASRRPATGRIRRPSWLPWTEAPRCSTWIVPTIPPVGSSPWTT